MNKNVIYLTSIFVNGMCESNLFETRDKRDS